jgi:fatty acid desaturase
MTYQDLRRQVQAAGLLGRSGWSSLRLALFVIALGGTSFVILAAAPGWWRVAAVPVLAVFWMQVGFFGHDAGHNGVFSVTEHNRRLGLFCYPLMLGVAFRPWVIKHNLHHAECNVVESDPDIQHPLLAFTEEAARERRGLVRWLVRYQAYLYPILALFATAGFRIDAWRYALGGKALLQNSDKYDDERRIELALLGINLVLWLAVPAAVFGLTLWLPIFVAAQMLLGFYMVFVFAPNHKGMPTYTDATRQSFLEQQVLTSRNVRGGPIVDFAYGGLNYQIEHHLFPRIPHTHYPDIAPIVRAVCARHSVSYAAAPRLRDALRSHFRHLKAMGARGEAPDLELG